MISGIMNALDYHGNTPLLKCALQDSRDTVRRLLSSKAAIERHMLDLSVQNMYGRNALHYLVLNKDKHNVKLFLNIIEDSKDALNAVDCYNMSPLMYCLSKDYMDVAETIINHPKAQGKLKPENADAQGKTILHLTAEKGNFAFWSLLSGLKSCNLCTRDDDGNTPLMAAAMAKQNGMIKSWLQKQSNKPTSLMVMAAQNSQGYNLFMLVIMHLQTEVIKYFISTVDLDSCIDQMDKEGNNALLLAATMEQWEVLKCILSNNKLENLAIDIHPKNKDGYTTLVLVLASSVKIARQIQSYKMKNDKINQKKMEEEAELLWTIVKLLLEKERDVHGTSVTTGKEAGIDSLKKQMEWHRQLKPPLTDDVINEFSKLYMVNFKAKKKPEPVPEIIKEEPKKVLAVSSFQEQMNAIYKESMESQKKRDEQKVQNNVSSIKGDTNKEAVTKTKEIRKVTATKEEKKVTAPKPEEIKPKNTSETNGVKNNSKSHEEAETSDDGPSLQEIRARWKKDRKPTKKAVDEKEFDLNSVMEDIMKKAESKVAENGSHEQPETKKEDEYLTESMNEEIQWAMQQKKQQMEEMNSSVIKSIPMETNLEDTNNVTVKKKDEEVVAGDKNCLTEKENISNLVEALEQKAEAKRLARIERQAAATREEEKRNEAQELEDLEDAMSEEIRWAYEQKALMQEERKKQEEKENEIRKREEESNNAMQAVAEKYRLKEAAKEKEKEEFLKKQQEEKEKLEKIQKEAEEKMKKLKEARESEKTEEDPSLAGLPRWKKEKILRERSSKNTTQSNGNGFSSSRSESPPADEKKNSTMKDVIADAVHSPTTTIQHYEQTERAHQAVNGDKPSYYNRTEDNYLAERLDEEMKWAEEAARTQLEDKSSKQEQERKKEKEREEKERQQKAKEEEKALEKLQKLAQEKLERAKLDSSKPSINTNNQEPSEGSQEIENKENLEKKTGDFSMWLQKEIEENEITEPKRITPPAPVRRKKTLNQEDQELMPPTIPNRRSKGCDKEKSPSVSLPESGSGVRSVGVCVDVRPGYAHASTQTDPVKTCDFSI